LVAVDPEFGESGSGQAWPLRPRPLLLLPVRRRRVVVAPTAVRPLLAWRYQREEGERQIRSEARSGGSKARLEVAELNPVAVELDLVSPAMAPACYA